LFKAKTGSDSSKSILKDLALDYAVAIKQVYQSIDANSVDKALMECLRISRHLKDHLHVAIFLRELCPGNAELLRALSEDIRDLKSDVVQFISQRSFDYWLEIHTLQFSFGQNDKGDEKNILALAAGELDPELMRLNGIIADLAVPQGIGSNEAIRLTKEYVSNKMQVRLRMSAVQTIKERLKARCLNYAIRIEKQLEAQRNTQKFLDSVQTTVNSYFQTNAEDVYSKLQKAAQLVRSDTDEDMALLLTEVRRALKSVADHFYPPSDIPVKCSDGSTRTLGNDHYMNRLQEFIVTKFDKSSSRDLLRAELDLLSVFGRRLNEIASKGVHDKVSPAEAKQGLVGMYLFLYNICNYLQQ